MLSGCAKAMFCSLSELYKVRTFPYINGRLFDVACPSYMHDDGPAQVVHLAEPYFGAKKLSLPTESCLLASDLASADGLTDGSGSTFNVADPSTQFWYDKYRQVVKALLEEYDVSGVYLDQVRRWFEFQLTRRSLLLDLLCLTGFQTTPTRLEVALGGLKA